MSVRMQQALDAFRRMSRAGQLRVMVDAGLMTEAEYQEALARPAPAKKPRRKPSRRQAQARSAEGLGASKTSNS